MFGLRTVRLGRPFGIPLEADVSWFLMVFFVAAMLTTSYLPAQVPDHSTSYYVFTGLVTALAFFAALVLHELAHSVVARAMGMKISRITLFLFGGASQMDEEPSTPGQEFLMAVAGPASSLVIAGVCWITATGFTLAGVTAAATVPLEYLTFINLMLAVFNLLPGFPLDGGRVLRAIIWAITKDFLRATKWASRVGQGLGVLLVGVAVVGVLMGTFDLLWFAAMGWFVAVLAAASYQQELMRSELSKVPLSRVMSSPVLFASGDLTLEDLVHSYFLGGRHRRHPVVKDGHVVGLIDVDRAREVPRSEWPATPVADVAFTDLARIIEAPDRPVSTVLTRLEPGGPGAILIVDGGRLAGIVTRSDIISLMREQSAKSQPL